MKILRVISSMDPAYGGPCQGIRNSIPELAKMGAYNEVVSLDEEGSSFGDSFTVHTLGIRKNSLQYSPKLVPWLLQNMMRFDAVIVHGLWYYGSYAVRKAINIYKKQNTGKIPRFYVMPHGMLDPYFQRASDRKLKALRNEIYWQLIERKVVQDADTLLFTCEAELVLARETFKSYCPKKEINVGYGIKEPPVYNEELQSILEKNYPVLTNKPFFLFLSRIHKKKGVDILLESYAALLQQYPDATIPMLVIAGPGQDTDYGKIITEMVDKNKALRDNVLFTGMLTGNPKWAVFYGCEAFVLPSHQENFGIAVVEALACKKPVLISNQVNIWREIDRAGAGLVAENTTNGVRQLLQQWTGITAQQKKHMGEKARQCFEHNFAIGPAANNLFTALTDN